MNVNALIDAIVRQTTVLIAQMATLKGGRVQLAHTANQVFLDLSTALREQGIGSKVIADMFGLALRTYQERVQRLSESRTLRGRSLWEAILEHVDAQGPCLRAQVLARFGRDDQAVVRSVLRDLVQSGLLYRSGRGDQTSYRAASAEELRAPRQHSAESLYNLVWIAVQRSGRVTLDELRQITSMDTATLAPALLELCARGLLRESQGARGAEYESHGCVLAYDDPLGWEAAVFDHFQAMVTALCTKLRLGQTQASRNDTVGGSTFGFEVWPGHPEYDNVLGFLARLRAQGGELRERVSTYNAQHETPALHARRVVAYVGQSVLGAEPAQATADLTRAANEEDGPVAPASSASEERH
jgi:hypothetical protein